MDADAALAYARKHALQALVVAEADRVALETYENGFEASTPHPLFSGTKSFWGVAAICAREDGLLSLDEPVAQTIAAWGDDPWKRRVTVRMLLALTSGFGFGGLGSAVPTYDRALAMTLKNEPGTTFTYGGIPLQVFGAVLARKVAPLTPHEYLQRRVLEPAGVAVASWRKLADGTQPLPTGAFLTARNWIAYGQYVLRERERLRECLRGTDANPRYGLGWWLAPSGAPSDLYYASGSGGQGMYVAPSHGIVAVHFGKGGSYKHEVLLKRLFAPS